MRSLNFLPALLAAFAIAGTAEAARKPANSVLLSNVQSLTLRKGLKTSARRVSAIPQLKCVGGNAKALYDIDVMRCKNAGSDYDDNNIQWTCTASLPDDYKLGSTDVICEGYESPDDPYILKGSCGVEYRLVLTEKGEEKHGKKGWFSSPGKDSAPEEKESESSSADGIVAVLFWIVFFAVVAWMLFSACVVRGGEARRPETWRPGWGGGGGGGGGDDPPPPYDWRPSPKPPRSSSYGQRDEPWRPGFGTGAAAGAAAGYFAGTRGNRAAPSPPTQRGNGGGWFGGGGGEGSSGRSGSSGSSGGSSTTRYESTGFGSTSRR